MKISADLREFSRYTFFSVLGTLGVSCYILADTFFVSKGLGTNGLAALNLAIPVYNFIHGTGLMLGMGGATRFSVLKGGNDQEGMDRIYMNTLYLAGFFSILFMLPGFFCPEKLALLLGADEATLEMTEIYLRWLLLFAPAFILNDVFLCFVRNDNGPRLSMAAMLLGSFSNIILDYIFIFPFRMGMFGAIFATGLSPVISMAVMALYGKRRKNTFHAMRTGPDADSIRRELSLGFPSLLSQVSSGTAMIVFNMLILSLEGNTGIAAYGVIANISIVVTAVYTGIAQGIQPLVSRFYGAGKEGEMKKVLHRSMVLMLGLSGIFYLLLFLFADPVVSVFNSGHDRSLQTLAAAGVKLYFLSVPFTGYNVILSTFFTSMEKALPAHILTLLRGFILLIPAAFAMAHFLGMTGVWITYPAVEFLAAVLGAWAEKSGESRKNARKR